jgi:hypothetical protein
MGDGDPTELAPTDTNTESVQAWGLDDDYEDPPTIRLTAGRITAAAVTASLVAITVAGVLAWQHLQDAPVDAAVTSSMVPATTMAAPVTPVVVAPPPPPPPVTITTVVERVPAPTTGWVPHTAAPMPPSTGAEDAEFLDRLTGQGWSITNAAAMVRNAHIVCNLLQQGRSPDYINGQLMSGAAMTPIEADSFASTVTLTYPNCP